MNHSEKTEFEKLKSGDKKVFTCFYNKYFRPLCDYAKSLVGDAEDAADIVQELFLKLWEDREKIDIKISIGSYLTICVRNNCYNFLDLIRVKGRQPESVLEQSDIFADGNDPESDLIAKERDREIDNALAELLKNVER